MSRDKAPLVDLEYVAHTYPDGTVEIHDVEFSVYPDKVVAPTVLDDAMFGLQNYGVPGDEAKKRAREALATVDASHLEDQIPQYLSGGINLRAEFSTQRPLVLSQTPVQTR